MNQSSSSQPGWFLPHPKRYGRGGSAATGIYSVEHQDTATHSQDSSPQQRMILLQTSIVPKLKNPQQINKASPSAQQSWCLLWVWELLFIREFCSHNLVYSTRCWLLQLRKSMGPWRILVPYPFLFPFSHHERADIEPSSSNLKLSTELWMLS